MKKTALFERTHTLSEKLARDLSRKNVLDVPRIVKVVVNTGLGRLLQTAAKPDETIEKLSGELSLLTGQKPVITKAKQSIASFKTRKGTPLGLKVTLRGARMYDFLDRLVNIAFPRSRDFRGIDPEAIDERGSLNLGIREHTIFPEVAHLQQSIGLQVTVVTNARTRDDAIFLFRAFGLPLKKEESPSE
jgi:large subunit ribosomal protein L5